MNAQLLSLKARQQLSGWVCVAAGKKCSTDWLEKVWGQKKKKTPSSPRGMQNIISAKCLKAVESIPITAQLECSLTTQTIMPPVPESARRHGRATSVRSAALPLTSVVCVMGLSGESLTSGKARQFFCLKSLYRCSGRRRSPGSPCCPPVAPVFQVFAGTSGCQLMTCKSCSFLLQHYGNMAAVSSVRGPRYAALSSRRTWPNVFHWDASLCLSLFFFFHLAIANFLSGMPPFTYLFVLVSSTPLPS